MMQIAPGTARAIGLFLLLLGCSSLLAHAQSPDSTVTVPLQVLDTGHIAIQVRLNGKGPFRMILDTGAPICIVNPSAARRAGLITQTQARQPALMGLLGMDAVKTVQVGNLKVTDLNVMIM